MHYLAVLETVTDAAAVCDYLQHEAESDDVVHAVTVHDPDAETPDSDRREALNVAGVRLAAPAVETIERRGAVDEECSALLETLDVDEIVVGAGTEHADDGFDVEGAKVVVVPEDN